MIDLCCIVLNVVFYVSGFDFGNVGGLDLIGSQMGDTMFLRF